MDFITGLILTAWIGSLAILILGTHIALSKLRKAPPHLDQAFTLFPVSILKPIKGVDPGLASNLETFFQLDYPEYELIFSIADASDPALAVVERAISQNPHVQARVLVGDVPHGLNPKVNNLIRSYREARYDLLLISDSNIRVQPAFLKRLVGHLDRSIGMVSAVVAGISPRGIGAEVEAAALGTFTARSMLLAEWAGHTCVIGKCMLFRRSIANRFGGVRALARYLAEDYMAGEAMKKLGYRVILMNDPVEQNLGEARLSEFWQRHLRWGRIRKAQNLGAFLGETLLQAVPTAFLAAITFGHPAAFVAHLGLWWICDALVLSRLSGTRPSLRAWLIREALAFPLWVFTALGNTVLWRGKTYTLEPGGLLKPVRESA
jgi:ceramide glucosyltransferase